MVYSAIGPYGKVSVVQRLYTHESYTLLKSRWLDGQEAPLPNDLRVMRGGGVLSLFWDASGGRSVYLRYAGSTVMPNKSSQKWPTAHTAPG